MCDSCGDDCRETEARLDAAERAAVAAFEALEIMGVVFPAERGGCLADINGMPEAARGAAGRAVVAMGSRPVYWWRRMRADRAAKAEAKAARAAAGVEARKRERAALASAIGKLSGDEREAFRVHVVRHLVAGRGGACNF